VLQTLSRQARFNWRELPKVTQTALDDLQLERQGARQATWRWERPVVAIQAPTLEQGDGNLLK